MNRPAVALLLTAVALGLLAVLLADLEQEVEDPNFAIGEKGAKAAADAAEKLGPDSADLAGSSLADGIRFPDGATFNIPEGAEIDGDLLRLLAAMDWQLPAGSQLDNLSMELPPGLGVTLPDGTWADGDTLWFPPNSTVLLDDGTELLLPEGGSLSIPGASSAQMAKMLNDGRAVTVEGSTFFAPRVEPEGDWPVTFPAGTTFTLPEGHGLEDGSATGDEEVSFPPDHKLQPKEGSGAEGDASWFERLGDIDFKSGGAAGSSPSGNALSGLGGGLGGLAGMGSAWLWVVLGVALLVAAWLLWRYRDRLMPGRTGNVAAVGKGRAADVRLVWTLGDRPPGLPFALAPGQQLPLRLAVERRQQANVPTSPPGSTRRPQSSRLPGLSGSSRPRGADHAMLATPAATWAPTDAQLELLLDGTPWHQGAISQSSSSVPFPTFTPGLHRLEARIRSAGHSATETVVDEVLVAPWAEQVAHAYEGVYEHARIALGLPDETTPRALGQALRRNAPQVDGLVEPMVLIFEIANYSERDVDEAQWLRFALAARAIHDALEPLARTGVTDMQPVWPSAPAGEDAA